MTDLSAAAQKLWEEYLAAEQDRIRDVTLPALDRFIAALLEQEPALWHAWARDLAAQVSDQGSPLPVRLPLFRRVLLPALADGVARSVPGCARWLAHFEPLLFHTDAPLPEGLCTAVGLLREALRRDPADQLARERLVQRLASYLEYTVHEVPDAVLYEDAGADAEQCDRLLEILAEFRSHLAALAPAGERERRFADLASECDLHFRSYREYLAQGRPGGSYETFLAARGQA